MFGTDGTVTVAGASLKMKKMKLELSSHMISPSSLSLLASSPATTISSSPLFSLVPLFVSEKEGRGKKKEKKKQKEKKRKENNKTNSMKTNELTLLLSLLSSNRKTALV